MAQHGMLGERIYGESNFVGLGKPRLGETAQDLNAMDVSMVYAMRVGDVIKIGCSRRLMRRRWELQGDVLAFRQGTLVDEQALHARLKDHRHHGREWYHPTTEVMAAVNEMREALGLEPLVA